MGYTILLRPNMAETADHGCLPGRYGCAHALGDGHTTGLVPVSRKSRELFGPEKPVVKLQSACFEKLIF